MEKIYNADEIGQRILNGDGGSWIREPYEKETVLQLDRFHIYQEIKNIYMSVASSVDFTKLNVSQ